MIPTFEKIAHVSEDNIRRLVDAFYRRVRLDPDLGPVFARAIPGDWQPHLNKMYPPRRLLPALRLMIAWAAGGFRTG
jgi:hypothetical protein